MVKLLQSRHSNNSTRNLLIPILLAKVVFTLFAVFVYGRLTTLGDTERYLTAQPDFRPEALLRRTDATEMIYAALKSVVMSDLLVHLTVSVAVGLVIWFVFRRSYRYVDQWIFWVCVLFPHFLVWTGVAGKEPLAVGCFFLVIRECVNLTVNKRVNYILLGIGFAGGMVLRPHYGLAYLLLFVSSAVFSGSYRSHWTGLSNGIHGAVLLMLLSVLVFLAFLTRPIWEALFNQAMQIAQVYFLAFESGSNRYFVDWEGVTSYLGNMWWGVPASIVGPLWSESMERPILIPVFIEGSASLLLIAYLIFQLFRDFRYVHRVRLVFLYGFLPALCLALLIHYPFGVFNPGSAMRYKQALAPLFYFYPLLLTSEFRRRSIAVESSIGRFASAYRHVARPDVPT